MIIYFQCSPDTKKQIDFLMNEGSYASVGDLISNAVDHLAFVQSNLGTMETAVFGEYPLGTSGGGGGSHPIAALSKVVEPPVESGSSRAEVPEIFALPDDRGEPRLAEGTLQKVSGKPCVEDWLFGQYNRFLPVKATCRALFSSGDQMEKLQDAQERISLAAVHLGDRLLQLDRHREAKRSEAFATAFPTSGRGVEKSRSRFGQQFVGYVSNEGELQGLPAGFGLVGMAQTEPDILLLTQAGCTFAKLENPLLDGIPHQASGTLTPAEQQFLTEHVRASVPLEFAAYKTVLEGLFAGANTPGSLDGFLLETATESSISETFLTTQRSGVVARMTELGLIARRKEGVHVHYEATASGKAFYSNGGTE